MGTKSTKSLIEMKALRQKNSLVGNKWMVPRAVPAAQRSTTSSTSNDGSSQTLFRVNSKSCNLVVEREVTVPMEYNDSLFDNSSNGTPTQDISLVMDSSEEPKSTQGSQRRSGTQDYSLSIESEEEKLSQNRNCNSVNNSAEGNANKQRLLKPNSQQKKDSQNQTRSAGSQNKRPNCEDISHAIVTQDLKLDSNYRKKPSNLSNSKFQRLSNSPSNSDTSTIKLNDTTNNSDSLSYNSSSNGQRLSNLQDDFKIPAGKEIVEFNETMKVEKGKDLFQEKKQKDDSNKASEDLKKQKEEYEKTIAMQNSLCEGIEEQSQTMEQKIKSLEEKLKQIESAQRKVNKVSEKENIKMPIKTSRNNITKKQERTFIPILERLPSIEPSVGPRKIIIDKTPFRIGRKYDNDEVIPDVVISREHCIIEYDKNNGDWMVKNLSSTDTLLNDERIAKNDKAVIKENDVLQMSLSDAFRYKFQMVKIEKNVDECSQLASIAASSLENQRIIIDSQECEKQSLKKQLNNQQEEQEKLQTELNKLLDDQKATKTCNEELNNSIAVLQQKIESSSFKESELQKKYDDLHNQLEKDRLKYEEQMTKERIKYEQVIEETKQEKELLEQKIKETIEEYKGKQEEECKKTTEEMNRQKMLLEMKITETIEEYRKKQETECKKTAEELKKQKEEYEKTVAEQNSLRARMMTENQTMEKKIKELEDELKAKEAAEKKEKEALLAANQLALQNCIVVEIGDPNNLQAIPILETIDLTVEPYQSTSSNTTYRAQESMYNSASISKNQVSHIMDENLTCSICSELFVQAMTTNCMHTYCKYCIESWVKRRRDCPNCRAAIVNMTRSIVVDNFIEKMVESLTPDQNEKRKQLVAERAKLTPKLPAHIKKVLTPRRR